MKISKTEHLCVSLDSFCFIEEMHRKINENKRINIAIVWDSKLIDIMMMLLKFKSIKTLLNDVRKRNANTQKRFSSLEKFVHAFERTHTHTHAIRKSMKKYNGSHIWIENHH